MRLKLSTVTEGLLRRHKSRTEPNRIFCIQLSVFDSVFFGIPNSDVGVSTVTVLLISDIGSVFWYIEQ